MSFSLHLTTHTHTDRMSEEDLLQLHSALTEGLSCVIKFLLDISVKDQPPEELVQCTCVSNAGHMMVT